MSPTSTGSNYRVGVVLVAVSAASFGCLAVFARMALDNGASPLTLLFLRFTFAAAAILPMLLITRRGLPQGRRLLGLIGMGGIYVGQSVCFFLALTLLKASLVSLLLYAYPVIVTILAVLFLHEKLTTVKLLALAMAIVGTGLAIGPVSGGDPLGIALGFGSAFFYSLYIIVGAKVLRSADPYAGGFVVIATAALIYLGLALFQGIEAPTNATGWIGVGMTALVATVIALLTFLAGLEIIGPVNASTISALEPAVTAILAALFLGETLLAIQIAGGVLILTATVVLSRSKSALETGHEAVAE